MLGSRHSLPASILRLAENAPGTVLLHDASPASSGFSRLFLNPLKIHSAHSPAELSALFDALQSAVALGLYAAGWFAYEAGAVFEPTAACVPLPDGEPLAWFGIYERCYRFDPRTGAFPEEEPEALRLWPEPSPLAQPGNAAFTFSETAEEYADKIDAIHEWIRRGDIYQLNYTIPMQVQWPGQVAELWQRLIRRQPAPYAAWIHAQPGRHLLSFSPELFFRLQEGSTRHIETRPMKGTTARGRFPAEDEQRATALQNDAKNRAENLMIVDLLRNDLGRLCRYGSVRTEDLFAVERHPTLWQMTSTVRGELRPEVGYRDLFRAIFPCGSITGAPKVRAMQLIASLEQRPRGVYTGSIGFFSPSEMVFNVTIRTLDLRNDGAMLRGTMGVGSGIVIDSDAQSEFAECHLKAAFLTAPDLGSALDGEEDFQLIETMLWQQGIARLELHLDRLQSSANFFDFFFERASTKETILSFCRGMNGAVKVRLLLQRNGELHLSQEPLDGGNGTQPVAPVRLGLWPEPVLSSATMLFHKTTRRELYTRALQRARASGLDDVIFCNEKGELTESCIANLFLQMDGQMLTPPVECGLLAGVERRHLLATLPNAAERILTREDLQRAESLWVCNAVRGLRRAELHLSSLLPPQ